MCKRHLWRILSRAAFALTLASGNVVAQDIPPGIVAIQAGTIKVPQPNSFSGSGFLIQGNWVVTARHVIEGIDAAIQPDFYYVTLGSRNDETNPIKVMSKICPDPEIDICFLKLDDADTELAVPLSVPFELVCNNTRNDLITSTPISTVGFIANSEGIHGPVFGDIQDFSGNYLDKASGIKFRNLIRTSAVTQSGLSGAPVMHRGTRKVVGVHTGEMGGIQVFTPLYELGGPIMFRGKEIACGAQQSSVPERTKSFVMNYTGEFPSEPEDEVGRLIFNGVSFIRDQVRNQPDSKINFGYLDLVGASVRDERFENFSQLGEIWKNDKAVLQILYGTFVRSQRLDAPFEIKSQIFLGDLPAEAGRSNQRNEFAVSTFNNVSDFRTTADGHHLILLYAMLLDAERLNKPDYVVLGLISVADYVIDALREAGTLNADLGFIAGEIDSIRAEYPL